MFTIEDRLTTKENTVTVTSGRRKSSIVDAELADAVGRAHSIWLGLRDLEARLSDAKAIIARRAEELRGGRATVSLQAGGVRCTVSVRHEALVPEENVQALRKLLGRRFRDLVRKRVHYSATSRLIEQAEDDVLSLIRLRRLSPQFRWSATCGREGAND
jgi:hypothetical protein